MLRFSLNSAENTSVFWRMHRCGDAEMIPARVPGSVYADLLAAGKMEDPYWRNNELDALALMENDYEYTCTFTLSKEMLETDRLLLCFEGLDTLCDIALNGRDLGHCDNMHRRWIFYVSRIAQEGENRLDIRFHSPTKYIRQEQEKCFIDGSSDAMAGFPHLRKAHCMFGWDWGPRLPDAGVWRSCYLMAMEGARIDSVHIRQFHEDGKVRLWFRPELIRAKSEEEHRLLIRMTGPDGETYETRGDDLVIENPKLWWTLGYGAQPLYTVTAQLWREDELLDEWTRRIGLRTMTMSREKDEWGEEFCHMVNGVKIFAMGADYIPEDNILSRVTPERTRALLEDACLAGMNAIRIWGGGYYPDDFFYDICDELGLVVWQDFMFACAMYELTDEFLTNIRQELIDNVKRLRHHASLGLWCGNNEMEWQVDDKVWQYTHKQYSDYIRMYEHVFPEVLKEHDPQTFYWPASPSSGGGFDNPNDPNRGDVHYWEVWHCNKPFSDYRGYHFRYASEFGFQSFPSEKTIATFTEPEDRNIFSRVMETHQRNNAANGKIMNYMGATFLYPTSFGALIYASQLLQAEAIKYGVEHWRRNRGRCMGAIIWQLNDCWPVASWASIDYSGRWKALHYYAKRFFAPVMLSCCEEGIMTQNTNPNAEPYPVEKSARLSVANETMLQFSGTVKWALRSADSTVKRSGEQVVQVAPLSSLWLEKMDFADADLYGDYLSFELFGADGGYVSGGTVIFCLPKHFHFRDPGLTAVIEGDEVVVRAGAYARSVEIDCPDGDLLLADNYFDMNAGERRLKILGGKPGTLAVRSVYDIR